VNSKVSGAQSFEIDATTNALLQQGLYQVQIEKYLVVYFFTPSH
jgi:hypothetical protein